MRDFGTSVDIHQDMTVAIQSSEYGHRGANLQVRHALPLPVRVFAAHALCIVHRLEVLQSREEAFKAGSWIAVVIRTGPKNEYHKHVEPFPARWQGESVRGPGHIVDDVKIPHFGFHLLPQPLLRVRHDHVESPGVREQNGRGPVRDSVIPGVMEVESVEQSLEFLIFENLRPRPRGRTLEHEPKNK